MVDNNGASIYSSERPVTLNALWCNEQDYLGVHDMDHYAESLMNELGVTEAGRMDEMASKLASATTTRKRPGFVGPQQLARNWKIGLEAAKRTVEATTQLAVRDFTHVTGDKRLKPYHEVLDKRSLTCPFFGDVMFGKCKSLRGNHCACLGCLPGWLLTMLESLFMVNPARSAGRLSAHSVLWSWTPRMPTRLGQQSGN